MSEEDETGFSHPIAQVIMDCLVPGESSAYAIDGEGADVILEYAGEALDEPNAERIANAILEVAGLLEGEGGSEASATLQNIFLSVGLLATDRGIEFPGFDEDDEVELTFGRRAAKLMGNKRVSNAPRADAPKPEGSVSLQELMGSKRRL